MKSTKGNVVRTHLHILMDDELKKKSKIRCIETNQQISRVVETLLEEWLNKGIGGVDREVDGEVNLEEIRVN